MINAILARLVAELRAEGVPDPLGERFNLSSLWSDLALANGEPVPAEVAARLDAPIAHVALAPARWLPDYTREATLEPA